MSPLARELLDQMLTCAQEHAASGSELGHTLLMLTEAKSLAQREREELPVQRLEYIEQLAYENAAAYSLRMTEDYAAIGNKNYALDYFKKANDIFEKINNAEKKAGLVEKATALQERYHLPLP